MGKIVILLIALWLICVVTSNTFGGLAHLFPVTAAILFIFAIHSDRRPPPPKQRSELRNRTTWKA